LLKLLRLDLEAHPPSAPVAAISMLTTPARAPSQQLGLFLPLSPDPERLEIMLARIQNTVGEGRVGAPVLLDTHGPESFQQNRFVLPGMRERRAGGEKQPSAVIRVYVPPLAAQLVLRYGSPRILI